ncbi:MAG: hypothetical protein R6U27_02405, partial [Desulfobacterales bacterium]
MSLVFEPITLVTGLFINPFLFIIGIFVFLGAGFEYKQVKYRSLLTDYKAGDVAIKDYSVLNADEPLKNAVDILLKTRQTGFLIKEDEEIVGILVKDNIISGFPFLNHKAPRHHLPELPQLNTLKGPGSTGHSGAGEEHEGKIVCPAG